MLPYISYLCLESLQAHILFVQFVLLLTDSLHKVIDASALRLQHPLQKATNNFNINKPTVELSFSSNLHNIFYENAMMQ